MDDNLRLLKNIVLIISPDQIEVENWFIHGDIWQIASWTEEDTYYYIGIILTRLNGLYHA